MNDLGHTLSFVIMGFLILLGAASCNRSSLRDELSKQHQFVVNYSIVGVPLDAVLGCDTYEVLAESYRFYDSKETMIKELIPKDRYVIEVTSSKFVKK